MSEMGEQRNFVVFFALIIFPLLVFSSRSPTTTPNCVLIPTGSSNSSDSSELKLDCSFRKLSVSDLIGNGSFEQPLNTAAVTSAHLKCNPFLIFQSFLDKRQTFLFQFGSLENLEIEFCKFRSLPNQIFSGFPFLRNLKVGSLNGEWKGGQGLVLEPFAFSSLPQLTHLNLAFNNLQDSGIQHGVFCPLENLQHLNLSFNRLTQFIQSDEEVVDCPLRSLRLLDLSHNSFTRPGFFPGENLLHLKLDNNFIQEISGESLEGLGNLKILDLSANLLTTLASHVFHSIPSLEQLFLQNNSIASISPEVWGDLGLLRVLDISSNALTTKSLPPTFGGLTQLSILRLSFNSLDYVTPNLFSSLTRLQSLHLDNNQIDSIHPQAFASLSSLSVLDLSRNQLTTVDSQILANTPTLRHLLLDHNKIKFIEPHAFAGLKLLQDVGLSGNRLESVPLALASGLPSLQTLDIGENNIAVLSNSSFQGLRQLYGLRLVDNRIQVIPPAFCQSLDSLRVLNLAHNLLTSISPSAFSGCRELRALRLDMNRLEDFPAYLSSELPGLLWLNLSRNAMNRPVNYRRFPNSLEWLDLSFNALEDLTSEVSGSVNYHLRVLDASHNNLTVLNPSVFPPSLETLRLNHNSLSSVTPDSFLQQASPHLSRVELMWNKLTALPKFPQRAVEFYVSGNKELICDCSMEGLAGTSGVIADLDTLSCRLPHSRSNQSLSIRSAALNPEVNLLCPYSSHCFALCHCCEFAACDCAMTCPDACTCLHDSSWRTNLVDCSSANYTQIPLQIPIDATEIRLDGNDLRVLSSHIFIGKKNLRILYLNGSRVEAVRNRTFNGLKNLVSLYLNSNLLRRLEGYEFSELENLEELYLEDNRLTTLAPNTFTGLKHLRVLRLSGNYLGGMASDRFNFLALDKISSLTSLSLASNPWSCQCDFLLEFRAWLTRKGKGFVVDLTLIKCQGEDGASVRISVPCRDEDSGIGQNLSPNLDDNLLGDEGEMKDEQVDVHAIHSTRINLENLTSGPHRVTTTTTTSNEDLNGAAIFFLITGIILLISFVLCLLFRKNLKSWRTGISRGFCPKNNNSPRASTTAFFGEKPTDDLDPEAVEDETKLFDAYFLYSKADEDLVSQKLSARLEKRFRICLHYRDLSLTPESAADMVLSACGASRRIFILLSPSFLHLELSRLDFHSALQTALFRYSKSVTFILLPPLTPRNVGQIYPEFRNPEFSSATLDWADVDFWGKLNRVLPVERRVSNSSHWNSYGRRMTTSIAIPPVTVAAATMRTTPTTNQFPPTYNYSEKQFGSIAFISQNKYSSGSGSGRVAMNNNYNRNCGSNALVSTHPEELEHLYSTLDSLHRFPIN